MRNVGRSNKLGSQAEHMIQQLTAAKTQATWDYQDAVKAAAKAGTAPPPGPAKVYLAVSDAIDPKDFKKLETALRLHGLQDVTITKFAEAALEKTRNKLRDVLGVPVAGPAGTAVVSADAIAEHSDGRDDP